MVHVATAEVPLRNPRGFHPAKVDGAGRLKMPARVLEYLNRLADKGLFVTKLYGMTRIYTNGAWESNLAKLAAEPELQAAVALEADRFGADAELDPQGRLTLPQTLRKAMGIEDQTVYLRFHYDVVLVYSQEQYDAAGVEAGDLAEAEKAKVKALGFV